MTAARSWNVREIHKLARQTVDGKRAVAEARGEYFRALIGTTQVELRELGTIDELAPLRTLRTVHRRFYPIVEDATTTPDIAKVPDLSRTERRRRALERNRRTNFARTAYGTVARWLRAPGHNLLKLDADTVTKAQLLSQAPPTRKHVLTTERVRARAGRFVDQLVGYSRMVAKAEPELAASTLREAISRLNKQMATLIRGKKAG